MQPDPDLAKVVDDLLRTDPRLTAAATLIGSVAVLVSEPKPQRVRKGRKKLPPPRLDVSAEGCTTTVTFHVNDAAQLREAAAALRGAAEGEELGDDAPAAPVAPWLKIVRAKVVSDATRAREGDRCLVELVVDGGQFAKLRSEDQRRALALALRGLRAEVREKDAATVVKREPPPLQTWPDTAEDLSHLVAALGVDGAEGAAAVSAAEHLGENPTDEDCALASERCDNAHLRDLIRDLREQWAADEDRHVVEWDDRHRALAVRIRQALGGEEGGE